MSHPLNSFFYFGKFVYKAIHFNNTYQRTSTGKRDYFYNPRQV